MVEFYVNNVFIGFSTALGKAACVGQSVTSAHAACAIFSHFYYFGSSGDLSDAVLPPMRGVSGDVVTVYA